MCLYTKEFWKQSGIRNALLPFPSPRTMRQMLYKYIFLYIYYKIYTLQSNSRHTVATAVVALF